jgi:hypothetical protein
MEKEIRLWLANVIRDALSAARRIGRPIEPEVIVEAVIKKLAAENAGSWAAIRDEIVTTAIARLVADAMRKAIEADESPQAWLPFPQYEKLPPIIQLGREAIDLRHANLDEFRRCEMVLAKKIRSYSYARRADANVKREEEELKELRHLLRVLTPYFAGDPTMTVARAAELHGEYLRKPSTQRQVKAGKGRQAAFQKSTT